MYARSKRDGSITMQKNEITVKLHYSRQDGNYADWNAWMWTLTKGGRDYAFSKAEEDQVATMVVDGHTTTVINFIVRKGQWETQEFAERQIDVSTVLRGTVHCYVTSGVKEVKILLGDDIVLSNKLLSCELDYDRGVIDVKTSMAVSDLEAFQITDLSGKDREIAISAIRGEAGSYELSVNKSFDLVYLYRYRVRFAGYDYAIQTNTVYASTDFSKQFT